MIQLQHLTITHTKDLRDLVKDLSINIEAGEKVGIIGEEGNGKSTLLHFLFQPHLESNYCTKSGSIQKQEQAEIFIPQQLPKELEKLTLNDYFFLSEADLDFSLLYQLANELGFDSQRFASDQLIASLSGGEKLKIQLLHQLSQAYDRLYLDEPSNDLDLDTLQWLKHFVKTSPKTILYISHDEDFLSQTADTIIHLQQLKKRREARTIVEHLRYDVYQEQRVEKNNKQRQQAKTEQTQLKKALEKHHRVKQSVEHTLRNTHDSTAGRLLAKKMKSILSQERRYEHQAEQMTQMPLLEESISLFFSDVTPQPASNYLLQLDLDSLKLQDTIQISPLHFNLKGQEKVGIIGSNGCGKSSFLRYLYQELQEKKQFQTGYMPQQYHEILPENASPLDFLVPSGDHALLEQARSYLANLTFSRDEMTHAITDLSGGQKGKLLLLKLVLDKPQLLLLDEPTRNFSPTSQPQVRKLFKDYPGAIITVSHDVRYLQEVCDRIYRLTPEGLTLVEPSALTSRLEP